MLSIIVCSRNKTLPTEFVANVTNTVGVDHEIIAVDNSENQYSIFSAYNIGISKSKYPYLCFVHDDVFFHSNNWGINVIAHLQDPRTGVIGLAGGDLVLRVPASWATLISVSEKIIKSDRTGRKQTILAQKPENYTESRRSVILLDGVFMCMRRELVEKNKFDEQFLGFHGYDFDITIQSSVSGYNNYVIYDVDLEHFSRGNTDINYYRNLIAVFRKWEKYLPIIGKTISEDERKRMGIIEERKLFQLTKKMVRKGFSTNEIIDQTIYYANLTGSTKACRSLRIRIFFIRLFNCPKYILK